MTLQRALGFNLEFDTGPLSELGQISPIFLWPSPVQSSTTKLAFPAETLGGNVEGQLKIGFCCYFCCAWHRAAFLMDVILNA